MMDKCAITIKVSQVIAEWIVSYLTTSQLLKYLFHHFFFSIWLNTQSALFSCNKDDCKFDERPIFLSQAEKIEGAWAFSMGRFGCNYSCLRDVRVAHTKNCGRSDYPKQSTRMQLLVVRGILRYICRRAWREILWNQMIYVTPWQMASLQNVVNNC